MFGYLREDDDGHMFIIPEDEVGEYDAIIKYFERYNEEDEYWITFCEVMEGFCDKYVVEGELYSKKILMES